MDDYYSAGDERFGYVSSRMYSLMTKVPMANKLYDFALSDMHGFEGRGSVALDVGAGTGIMPILLRRQNIFKEVYAVEPSIHMLHLLNRNIGRENVKGVIAALGSSTYVPFRRKFRVIYSTLSFHHWAQKVDSLRYLSHFLDRDGELRIYEVARGDRKHMVSFLASSHSLDIKSIYPQARASGLKVSHMRMENGFVAVSLRPASRPANKI